MGHRIEREPCVRAARVQPSGGQAMGREPFSDEKNDAERFLHDPVLEIENAKAGEREEAEQRKQLVAPFHRAI